MKLKYLLVLNMLLAFVGGLGLVFAPAQTFGGQGVALGQGGVYAAQIMGVMLLGFGLMSWKLKAIKENELIKPVLGTFAFIHLGILILNIMVLRSHFVNNTGWGDLVLHGVLGFGFLYYSLKK